MIPIETILREVLQGVTPSRKERLEEKRIAEEVIGRIKAMDGKHVGAMLVGSIARDTHLRGDRDIDIFVFYPESMPRAEFEREGLGIGKKAFKGHRWWEEYSEHPYIKGEISGFEVEIVPSYKVARASELKSAVDRSPFHIKALKKYLNPKLRREIRLMKAFLRGIDCYGAKIEKEGFSGYLAELVAVKYGSFRKCLEAISEWDEGTVLSLSKADESAALGKFDAPLIFIDPTDKNRNVAAALSIEQFARVVAAARAFLEKPGKKFFYPKRKSSISKKHMKKLIRVDQVFAIRMPFPGRALSDVIWGQMRRFKKLLSRALECEGFLARRISLYGEEGKGIDYFVELESMDLNDTVIFTGPFAWNGMHSDAFTRKHKNALTGPRIEEGRWVVEKPRKHTNALKFSKEFLRARKKHEKQPFRKALSGAEFLEKKQFLRTAGKDDFFKYNLSRFLEGRESFI